MPAQSKQQQKLFGLALSVKRGDTPRSEVSDDVLGIVDKMSEKEIEDFASTDHKGLPTKKEEIEEIIREKIREMLNPIMKEGRAFVQAAKKAQQEGKTEFEFNGKTYPITLKEEVITEMSDKEFVGDQLIAAGEGSLSRNEFIKVVSKKTKLDKNMIGKVHDIYLKLDGRQRVKLDTPRNMDRFLDKLGITESIKENGDTMEREIVNEEMVKIEVDMFKQFNQRKPDRTMPMKIDSKTPLSKLLNHTTFKAMKQKYDYIELHYGDKFLGSAMAGTDNWEFKKGRGLKDTSFRESVNEATSWNEDEKAAWEYVLSTGRNVAAKSKSKALRDYKNLFNQKLVTYSGWDNSVMLTKKGIDYLKKHGKSLGESVNENKINIDKKVTNIIKTRDFKEFVRYINSFYGKKGVYSSGKDVKEKDIMKALYKVFKRNNSYEWGYGDSVDRELVRDELMKMGILSNKMYEQEVNEANGEFVTFIEKDNGRKKLLRTSKSQRAANMFMRKHMDSILNKSGIRSIGTMSKDQWEKKEAMYAENTKKKPLKTVSRKKWNKTHRDFKTIIDGQPYMTWYDEKTHATVLGPVQIKEDRQLKDPKKEMMVAKKGKVKVIDKKDWNKYKSKGYIVAENKKAEELWSQTIDMLDKNLSKGYDPSKIRNVNLIAGTLQKLFKGLPQRNAMDMATSYNDYKAGQKDKKQTVKDWVRILKKHQIKEASLSVIHKAAKQGSYPVTVMAIDTKKRKVVKQELVKTPMAVPAAFMMMQGGYPEASIAVEDAKGQIIYKEEKQ